MPKVKWSAADEDNALTADDIDSAEDRGFTPYDGEIPRGGVYRFRLKRTKVVEFSTGNQGFNSILELDGSWKPEHAQYDGCPLWDRVVMTKSAAAFAKAFAAALGVTARDLVNGVVKDEEDVVTKIGPKAMTGDLLVYINVKRGSYDDEVRLEKAGTGYLLPKEDSSPNGKAPAKKATKAAKAAPVAAPEPVPAATKKKGKKGKAAAEEEAPF